MSRAIRPLRIVGAAGGVALVAAGLLAAYWGFYKIAPLRHLSDPKWLAAHSESARWAEEQADYRRLGSSPDLCIRGDQIGFYGGKDWFLWLEERIRNPGSFRHCGCTEYALALMANRHVSHWKEWSDANRERSQEEWIRDGFLEYGVTVNLPPALDDPLPLIRLLGRKSWNFLWSGPQGSKAPGAVPSYIHYNAYRWLRDSGFDPGKFASTNPALVAEPEVMGGLLRFSQWRVTYPGHDGMGVLAFGKSSVDHSLARPASRMANPWVLAGFYAFLGVSIIGGFVLLFRCATRSSV